MRKLQVPLDDDQMERVFESVDRNKARRPGLVRSRCDGMTPMSSPTSFQGKTTVSRIFVFIGA